MPRMATEPLTKVTFNMNTSDVKWYKNRYGQGWSEVLRDDIRKGINREVGKMHSLMIEDTEL